MIEIVAKVCYSFQNLSLTITEKGPKSQMIILLNDTVPLWIALLTKNYVSEMTTSAHLTYSADLAPSDPYLVWAILHSLSS